MATAKPSSTERQAVAPAQAFRRYVVAPGRGSFQVPGGSRGPGDEVRAEDFPGGLERIRELVAAGYLVAR